MATFERSPGRRWTDGPAVPQRQPARPSVSKDKPRNWIPFLIGVAASIAALAALVALVLLHAAGTSIASIADDSGQGAAALAAGVSCALLARRSKGQIRLAWSLIAVSAFITVFIGAGTLAAYQLSAGRRPPFPSVADGVFLAGQAFAIAGVLSFPSSPARTSGRSRVTIDALVIAISLLYVTWAFGLGDLYNSTHVSVIAGAVGLAYPITDMVVVTILLLALRRAPRTKYGRLGILLAAFVAKLVADCGFAVVSADAQLNVDSHWIDIAWICSYALIALSTWWPTRPAIRTVEEGPTTLWMMLMPWLGLVAVILSSLILSLAGRPISQFLVYPGVALVALLMASQLMSYKDSLKFLNKSRQAEVALQARTNLLNQVITHAPLGVARISQDFRFIDANPRMGSLLHAPMKILIGALATEFIERTEDSDATAKYATLVRGEADTIEEDGAVKRADGSASWLHWSTTAVRKGDGSFDYFLAMAEDVNSRHEAEEAAMENLAGLERLNQMKSEFVSMVSHEFRTALVGIQGFSEIIHDDDGLEPAEVKSLAGDINKDAMRLNRMISEMLDLDRMEAGKIRLDLKAVDINTLLKDAVVRAQIGTDKHHIVADLDVALPLVRGDSDRLIQVVSNLLSNAIKYSPDGGEVKVTSRGDGGSIHVSVRDHGLGIPAEFINRVFGRYERYESNRTSKVAGTGLGLAISRQIVELHGGKIWVESEAGQGSTFHLTLPVAAAVAAA